MDTAAEMAKGSMDEETSWMVFDMLKNRCAGCWVLHARTQWAGF